MRDHFQYLHNAFLMDEAPPGAAWRRDWPFFWAWRRDCEKKWAWRRDWKNRAWCVICQKIQREGVIGRKYRREGVIDKKEAIRYERLCWKLVKAKWGKSIGEYCTSVDFSHTTVEGSKQIISVRKHAPTLFNTNCYWGSVYCLTLFPIDFYYCASLFLLNNLGSRREFEWMNLFWIE